MDHTNHNNVDASLHSSTTITDDVHQTKHTNTKKIKRSTTTVQQQQTKNNNTSNDSVGVIDELNSSSSSSRLITASESDDPNVCHCLSLYCRCSAMSPVSQKKMKKKRCNDVVGKNNLELKSSDVDNKSKVCLHLFLGPTCCICMPTCCDVRFKKMKLGEQETNTKTKNGDNDQWEIKKVLKGSDICHSMSRLLLNRELAMDFVIPVLGDAAAEVAQQKDGIQVQVWDVDNQSLHSLVFKIWPSAQSHVFTKTWIKDFVLRRDLKQGDHIGLQWDQLNQRFDFSVLDRS